MLQNDRMIRISAAGSRYAARWPAQELCLEEFYRRLESPSRGTESRAAYLALPKRKQDELKDVGGFVGGTLAGEVRKAHAVTGRDLITLDMDRVAAGGTADIRRRMHALPCGWALYSTRKHGPEAPRLRAVITLDRTVSADEYEPLARRIAQVIDTEMYIFDPTTFQAVRLMYWPSCCSDGEYIFEYEDKPLLSADGLLAQYADWTDAAAWPRCPGEAEALHKSAEKAEDPTSKGGIVGAFCRSYNIYKVIKEILPGIYEPCDGHDGRYTFLGGSTTGGAVVYGDGLYLYSHHATDPAGGRLCNAFDLVRLHKFGELDDTPAIKPGTPVNKLPSYVAMCRMAMEDSKVSVLMAREDFADSGAPEEDAEANLDWALRLTRNSSGQYEKTYQNLALLLEHHPKLRDRIKFDAFADRIIGVAPLPWGEREDAEGDFMWSDADDNGLKIFVEQTLRFRAPEIINVALSSHFAAHSFNPVTDYLSTLKWDGTPRLDTIFSDYLGAEDDEHTRTVARKSFVAAVARAFVPGTKFDNMTTIISEKEGIGKSTLLDKMSRGWFNDNMITFEGNKASEALQGAWIIEVAEMHALAKTDINRIKQFLSQREDIYRRAYGRRTEWHPRRCVFFGTGNDTEYISDAVGGRRHWAVDAGLHPPKKSVFRDLDDEVDQIWAEAVMRWRMGEPLYLDAAQENRASVARDAHRAKDPRAGEIIDFVEREVPEDWVDWPTERRRIYWGSPPPKEVKTVQRMTICASEVWCELFGKSIADFNPREAAAINNTLRAMSRWERKGAGRVGPERKVVKHFARKKGRK
ncbi:virulence-associated E family protein [Ruminococcaceae bacterium OttesenSCG-928-I18]|nr:virulence-associated E family protein [Ruminococcaceae bacterium OttesenSCG-928-I18]